MADSKHVIPFEIHEPDLRRLRRKLNPLHSILPTLEALTKTGLTADQSQIIAYSLFREQETGVPGKESYRDLEKIVPDEIRLFNRFVDWKSSDLRLHRKTTRKEIQEGLGVAATLLVGEKMLGLTAADFERIDETRKRTFDFEHPILIASTGQKMLELEAKGYVDAASLSGPIKSIRDKKRSRRIEEKKSKRTGRLFAGVVFDIRTAQSSKSSKLVFVDPPLDDVSQDPLLYKVTARLGYYLRHFAYISPFGRLPVALANRLSDILKLGISWRLLDGVKLEMADRKPFEKRSQWGWTINLEGGRLAFGAIIDLRLSTEGISFYENENKFIDDIDPPLFFIGVDSEVLDTVVRMNFDEIMKLEFQAGPVNAKRRSVRGMLYRLSSGVIVGQIDDRRWGIAEVNRAIHRRDK